MSTAKSILVAIETLKKELESTTCNADYHLRLFKEYETKIIGLKEALAELNSLTANDLKHSFVCKQSDVKPT